MGSGVVGADCLVTLCQCFMMFSRPMPHSFVLIFHAETGMLFEEENLERRELSLQREIPKPWRETQWLTD